MISAIGIEMSTDTELASVVTAARPDGASRYEIDLAFYGPAAGAVTQCAGLSAALECCGLFYDPAQVAGLLAGLQAAGCWLQPLTAIDVAAASYGFKAAVRARQVKATGHEALKAAMQYAIRRPLAAAFAFERRRVPADMSPLNAASFALHGLVRNEAGADPGAWVI